jgi:hypothetical protein
MTWRSGIIWMASFTAFGACTWASQPYWDGVFRPDGSSAGVLSRRQRDTDSAQTACGRAALGGAAGLVASLLSFTVRGRRRRN